MAVSLRQIAEETGMSIGTVSRVLRGDTMFAKDTTEKIKRVASELGYRPNLLVHSLQAGRTKTIGVMLPTNGEFLGRVVDGIHRTLATNDYVPMLLWAEPGLPELAQIHRLVDRRVDGMILFTTEDTATDAYLSEIWERKLPAVTIDRRMPNTHADFVGTDDRLGGQLAAEHLLERGHRKLMHLCARMDISTSQDRWQGFQEVIAKHPDASVTQVIAPDFPTGFEIARKHFADNDRPTAVFSGNDFLAFDAIRAARSLNLSVPEDISILGFADVSGAAVTSPALTTFRQDPELIGRTAAQVVLDRLSGKLKGDEPHVVQFPPELVARASTGPVRT